jgi:hypothetical protein
MASHLVHHAAAQQKVARNAIAFTLVIRSNDASIYLFFVQKSTDRASHAPPFSMPHADSSTARK